MQACSIRTTGKLNYPGHPRCPSQLAVENGEGPFTRAYDVLLESVQFILGYWNMKPDPLNFTVVGRPIISHSEIHMVSR